jgi:enediyne core biosynthesis thioesterase
LKYYEYKHVVGLEETNVTGNVYFVNHLRWQGRCREMFLHDYAPGVLRQLSDGLSLLTVRCSCEYLGELAALDEISVRLFLEDLVLNRLVLRFEYWRISGAPELVAHGSQEIACMRRTANGGTESVEIPDELRRALEPYRIALMREGAAICGM